ncbi:MAG TPA: AprI/Inh family metalloprotease inhibitor [Rhizomicrobium sp.]|jgi:hypothetical protein
MNKFHSIALGGVLALGLIGLAQADNASLAGTWKLATGSKAPCTVTLTAESAVGGTVGSEGDCAGTTAGRYKQVGNGIQLISNTGDLIAWLHPKGDAYTGTRVADSRTVTLSH